MVTKLEANARKDITFGSKPADPLCQCLICRGKIQFQAPSELVDAFIDGRVALFVGAGVSSEAPGVMPNTFHEEIGFILSSTDRTRPFPDLMEEFCRTPSGRPALIERIQERFQYIYSHRDIYDHATRFHRELATFFPINT